MNRTCIQMSHFTQLAPVFPTGVSDVAETELWPLQ